MHENLVRIKAVNQVLKELDQELVFVGGATVSLYATDAKTHLRNYFYEVFHKVIHQDDFVEGLYSHLSGGYGGIDANYILIRLKTAFNLPD